MDVSMAVRRDGSRAINILAASAAEDTGVVAGPASVQQVPSRLFPYCAPVATVISQDYGRGTGTWEHRP